MGIKISQGYFISPPIVLNGLVLAIDAANSTSYVNGSTLWKDVSSNNNTGTLINTPTYTELVGKTLYFTTNEYVNYTGVDIGTTHSVELWVYPTITNSGRWMASTDSYYFDINGSDITFNINTSPRTTSNSGIQIGNWNHCVFVRDNTSYTVYVNGSQIDTGNNAAWDGIGFTLKNIAADSINGYYAEGYLSMVKAYNRTISYDEVLQNYNAHKFRFGLP